MFHHDLIRSRRPALCKTALRALAEMADAGADLALSTAWGCPSLDIAW